MELTRREREQERERERKRERAVLNETETLERAHLSMKSVGVRVRRRVGDIDPGGSKVGVDVKDLAIA